MPYGGHSLKPTRFPYIHCSTDADGRAKVGGRTIVLKAAAALKLGDAVYLSAADTVNKSATVGNHDQYIGIVVGGKNTNMEVINDEALVNVATVADADEDVIVQIDGIAYVIAAAAASAGDIIIPDTTTAGRVKAGTTATLIVGTLLEAPTGAADVARALLWRG